MRTLLKKINNFGLMALLLAGTTAFAFKPANNSTVAASQWTRVLNEDEELEWRNANVSGSCESSSGICRATFPDNYDPSMHTDTENQNAAIGSYTQGFVVE
ncbi:hypothetical protein ACFQZX_17760 [Mucilaginibacter litoreus]|uniref:Uncharacterized protein n=1 Tax=Mucilaginibacter litoreus TaxID=1048221 RepID=A0ABW3AX02_9SPHI